MAARSLSAVLRHQGFLSPRATRAHSHFCTLSQSHSRGIRYVHNVNSPAHRWPSCAVGKGRQTLVLSGHIHSPLSWCVVRGYSKKVKKDKVTKGSKKKVELSTEELQGVLDLGKLQEEMAAVAEDLKQQMIQQVSLRTNIGVYDNLPVKTDDGVFPLIQLGQVVQKNPTLILVNMASSPQYIKAVKEALDQSGLNISAQQDGTTIFIPVPKITREHREGLARSAKMIHDKAKTRLRDIHNKYVKKVKATKDHHPEDIVRAAQDLVLEEMHSYGHQLDAMLAAKQEELLGGK